MMVRKNENVIFHDYFFSMDISLPSSYKPFAFSTCIHKTQMQGRVSQNVDLGPGVDFIKYRNLNIKT